MKFSSHPGATERCKFCEREIADAEVRLSWFGARFPMDDVGAELAAHVGCAARSESERFFIALAIDATTFPRRAEYERVRAVWAEALDDRGDLGKRAVLADALQAIGDPRGELIALQLRAPGHARIEALLVANRDAWLDDIMFYARRIEIAAGFPARIEARGEALVIDGLGGPIETLHQPWIEDLKVGTCAPRVYEHLVYTLPGVRRIEILQREAVPLVETSRPYTHVACGLVERGHADLVARVLAACAANVSIVSFAIAIEALPQLRASPLFARLTSLTLVVPGLRDALPILPSLPPDLRVVLSRTAELPAIGGGTSELVIEGDAITASGEWIRAGLVPHLPRRVARVTAIGASPELAAMAGEGYELVTRPAPIATVVECD